MKRLLPILLVLIQASVFGQGFQKLFNDTTCFSEEAYDIASTSDGGFIVAGRADASVIGSSSLTIKFDSNGDTLWTTKLNDGVGTYGYSIIEISSGGYLIGNVNGSLIKLDVNGAKVWEVDYGNISIIDVQECTNGDFIILGYNDEVGRVDNTGALLWGNEYSGYGTKNIIATADNGAVLVREDTNEGELIKLNSSGTVVWSKRYKDPNSTIATYFESGFEDDNGNLIIAAKIEQGFPYGIAIFKFDSNGGLVWEKVFQGAFGSMLATQMSNGDYAFHIEYSSNIFLKMDDSGNIIWSDVYNYISSGSINSITGSTDNGILTAGSDAGKFFLMKFDSSGNNGDCFYSSHTLTPISPYIGVNSTSKTVTSALSQSSITHNIVPSYITDSTIFQISVATPDICVVTVDQSSTKNVIVWEKPASQGNIDGYNIYRDVVGIYTYIDFVPYDSLSQYIDDDAGINPNNTQYRYKIAALDSCGNESDISTYHQTIHLNIPIYNGSAVDLVWQAYDGFSQSYYYRILRDTLSNNDWEVIDSVSNSTLVYTDNNPPLDFSTTRYLIEIGNFGGCTATKAANYSQSRSNRPTAQSSGGSGIPTAGFLASFTNIPVGWSVDFVDQSTNSPTSWSWTFSGGSPFTSTMQNPTGITYNLAGTYDVSLVATNANGSDTETKSGYITVGASGIEDFEMYNSIRLYPNPNNGEFTLEIENTTNYKTIVSLYNSVGQLVISESYSGNNIKQELNISKFGAGIYNVEININGQSTSKRLVVK